MTRKSADAAADHSLEKASNNMLKVVQGVLQKVDKEDSWSYLVTFETTFETPPLVFEPPQDDLHEEIFEGIIDMFTVVDGFYEAPAKFNFSAVLIPADNSGEIRKFFRGWQSDYNSDFFAVINNFIWEKMRC